MPGDVSRHLAESRKPMLTTSSHEGCFDRVCIICSACGRHVSEDAGCPVHGDLETVDAAIQAQQRRHQ